MHGTLIEELELTHFSNRELTGLFILVIAFEIKSY
jgi:hypothetical protein